jgi:uncharacterized membrane protein
MNPGVTLLLSFSIATLAGFRSLVTPAVVAWAAHLKWINLQHSPLSFMGTTWAVGIFTLSAGIISVPVCVVSWVFQISSSQ